MSSLSMMESRLPPGFRFHPRDDELVCDYLARKSVDGGATTTQPLMIDIDFNKCEPWELPDIACVGGKEWYFFSIKDKKYSTGHRTNRATKSGYWKATGKDRPVARGRELVGSRKTLVFYRGRAPKGHKTDWVMHEFRIEPAALSAIVGQPGSDKVPLKEDWVLCRVFYKSRGGSSNTSMENDESASPPPPTLPTLMGHHTFISFDQEQHPPYHPSTYTTQPTPSTASTTQQSTKFDFFMNPKSQCEDGDKKVVKVVWDHIAKLEGPTNTMGWDPPPPLPPKLFVEGVGVWNPFGYHQ